MAATLGPPVRRRSPPGRRWWWRRRAARGRGMGDELASEADTREWGPGGEEAADAVRGGD